MGLKARGPTEGTTAQPGTQDDAAAVAALVARLRKGDPARDALAILKGEETIQSLSLRRGVSIRTVQRRFLVGLSRLRALLGG